MCWPLCLFAELTLAFSVMHVSAANFPNPPNFLTHEEAREYLLDIVKPAAIEVF